MKAIQIPSLSIEQLDELERLYHSSQDARLRTRAPIVLLAAGKGWTASANSEVVRHDESTVRLWLKRYLAEGVAGLSDKLHPGAEPKVTVDYEEKMMSAVRHRPRSLGLSYSTWTLQRLADYLAEETGIRVDAETGRLHLLNHDIVLSRTRSTRLKKTVEEARDGLKEGDMFYYADEFNVSWLHTL